MRRSVLLAVILSAQPVRWSSLGVHSGNTAVQNSTALNALPVNVTVIADNPGGGTILFNQWLLKDNLRVVGDTDNPTAMECQFSFETNSGGISQANINDADGYVSNVRIQGLDITKTVLGRLFRIRVKNFKLLDCDFNPLYGFMFLAGSNIEIARCTMPLVDILDGPGIRFSANGDLVSSDPSFPYVYFPQANVTRQCNVWVHDCVLAGNDSPLQVDPASTGASRATDILFEDNYCFTIGGNALLLGGGMEKSDFIAVRRCTLHATGQGFRIGHFDIPEGEIGGGIENILLEDIYVTGEGSTFTPASIIITDEVFGAFGLMTGPISNIHLKNVEWENVWRSSFRAVNVNDLWIENPTMNVRRRTVSNDLFTLQVDGGEGLLINSGTINGLNATSAIDLIDCVNPEVTGVTCVSGTILETNLTNPNIHDNVFV